MATIGNVVAYETADYDAQHDGTLTLSAAPTRKVDLHITVETTNFPTTVLVNGVAPTPYGTNPEVNPNDANMRMWAYYYDVPGDAGAGPLTIQVTTNASGTEINWHAFEVLNAVAGPPEALNYAHTNGGAATASVTATADAALTAVGFIHAGTQVIDWTGSVTEVNETNAANQTTSGATASAVTAGAKTATATPNSAARTSVALVSWANAVSAPTASLAGINTGLLY